LTFIQTKPIDWSIRFLSSVPDLPDLVTMLLRKVPTFAFVLVLSAATSAWTQSNGDGKTHDGQKSAQKSSGDDSVDEQIYDVGGDVKAPRVLHRVIPEFTEKSRDRHVEGSVILAAVVTSKGEPRQIRVQKGVEQDLDEQAVDALKQWQFAPGTKDNKPVATRVSIEIRFNVL
jgi:periplasmic protein TonB